MADNTYRTPTPGPLGPSTTAHLTAQGTYNGGHIVLGTYHIWVGTGGVLYIKNGVPANATDGTVVGAQT